MCISKLLKTGELGEEAFSGEDACDCDGANEEAFPWRSEVTRAGMNADFGCAHNLRTVRTVQGNMATPTNNMTTSSTK